MFLWCIFNFGKVSHFIGSVCFFQYCTFDSSHSVNIPHLIFQSRIFFFVFDCNLLLITNKQKSTRTENTHSPCCKSGSEWYSHLTRFLYSHFSSNAPNPPRQHQSTGDSTLHPSSSLPHSGFHCNTDESSISAHRSAPSPHPSPFLHSESPTPHSLLSTRHKESPSPD